MTAQTKTLEQAAKDFDFIHGVYKVHNRILRQRLAGCQDWDEFEAVNTGRPTLRGAGNEDEFVTDYLGGFTGMSFRFLNPKTLQWSIYWASSRYGVLEAPVQGSFKDGTGIFCGADTMDGRPILVRFIWSRTDTDTPRWEQAYSGDGGLNWETNWIMDFSRME